MKVYNIKSISIDLPRYIFIVYLFNIVVVYIPFYIFGQKDVKHSLFKLYVKLIHSGAFNYQGRQ
jgi:hypothetical protein